MSWDPASVERFAALARLDLTAGEREAFVADLEAFVEHFHALDALCLDGDAPAHAAAGPAGREDTPRDGDGSREALRPAPDAARGHFRVPRVIG